MTYTKVYVIDEDLKIEKFRVEHGATFSEVVGGYCRRTMQRMENLEFTYNGEQLTTDLAAEAVSVNNDCVIRVANKATIQMKIYDETGMDNTCVKMEKVRINRLFEDIKREYAELVGKDASTLEIESDGKLCHYCDSPKTMGLIGTKWYRVDAYPKGQ